MIAVIGDFIHDIYIHGKVERISPESPIPVFVEERSEVRPGGAGNVEANLRSLGNRPKFYYTSNSVKRRYVCDNHIMFRSDTEKYAPHSAPIDFDLDKVNYCILSDYNKGFLHESQKVIDYCLSKGCRVVVDPKKHLSNYKRASIVKLNKKELEVYASPSDSLKDIREMFDIGALVVTDAERGVVVSSHEFEGTIPADSHQVSDVTGAGDVFISAMTHFLDRGDSLYDSCRKATKLASISVTKFGTYVLTEEDIAQTRTVFTNGCFDILHRGHVEYLKRSRALGAKLIVGLNSDSSVRRLKGSSRPVNSQEDRKAVLESLDCVDEVVIFDEDTPFVLIKSVKPDIITKGGDYSTEQVVGNDLADVVIIPFVQGYSTTKTLELLNEC